MSESKAEKVVGWIGAGCGITGALLLAMNFQYSGFGYIFFLVSSVVLSVWSYKTGAKHNLMMQLCFVVLNSLGTYNWLIK